LDITECCAVYNLGDYNSDEYKSTMSTGWAKHSIPLKDADNWDSVKTLVKHLRLWVEGNSKETLKIASIAVSGDKWEKSEKFKVTAISNLDNPEYADYDPFSDPAFRSYYEDMY